MNQYKILLVDDEPANLFLLEEILSDYQVTSVKNANEMFDELEKETPDIILLDIMMPGTDGITAAQLLREDERFIDIPLIFISAKNTGEDVADGLSSGAEDYIRKPFNNTELLARVLNVLKRKDIKTELYRKATRDSLTGIFNREYFFESLSLKISKIERENPKFTLGIMDIDHFKKINDTWGHQAGDTVLKNLAYQMNKSLREYDILARYGGEEFIFIIDGILKDRAVSIVDRIREKIAGIELDPENYIKITFSCGLTDITDIDDKNQIADSLVKTADRRLYIAKFRGRNMVVSSG